MAFISLIPIFNLLILVASQAKSSSIHDQYLKCLHPDQNSASISAPVLTHSPNNLSYRSLYYSSVRNFGLLTSTSLSLPHLIVTPSSEYEIQSVLHCATKLNIRVRIRSGGHDYEGLSYTSTTPFVLIDLRNFRSISIDTEENTAWVDSGATLGELYHEIAVTSKTLGFPAGVCPTVGVGGHFSGGGYSMMSLLD